MRAKLVARRSELELARKRADLEFKRSVVARAHAARARKSLYAFLRYGWDVLEPGKVLEENWHLEAICDHLQAMFEDWRQAQRDPDFVQRCRNLVVNVPPGTMKSRITSVAFPAWAWLEVPSFRTLCLSTNPKVALRDADLCRQLVRSPWYQKSFDPSWQLRDDQDAKSIYGNTASGFRAAIGFTANVVGERFDAILIDDPHDPDNVYSEVQRSAVIERYTDVVHNRVNDMRSSFRVLICQRVHEADLSGTLLGTVPND